MADALDADDFDGLVLPGGVANPDQLRMVPRPSRSSRGFVDAGKPIAAICHAPWTLIDAGVVRGRTLTSWPSLKTDLTQRRRRMGGRGGARRHERPSVLVTSRKPDDLPAFTEAMVEAFGDSGVHGTAASRGRVAEW